MKKNIIIIFLLFSMTLMFVTYMMIIKPKKEENLDSAVAIMVYDEDINDYVKTNIVPKAMKLNKKKTRCIAGGTISGYDSANGTVTYSLDTADQCYLYFDIISGTPASFASSMYEDEANQQSIASNGAGLYYHDENLANGAGDNTYRYAGADANVNNYVCFEGDDCTNENNLYRIISINGTTERMKVIKATSLGTMQWNSKSSYRATETANDTVMGLTNRNTYYNIWAIEQSDGTYYTSSLNDYLNSTYYESLTFKDLIEETTWSTEGYSTTTATAKTFRTVEISDTPTYIAKIGLMYPSEYGYAAPPNYWTTSLYDYDSAAKKYDWLYWNNYEWTFSRYSSNTTHAFRVKSSGGVGNCDVTNSNSVRPSFNLKSSVKIKNAGDEGIGTKTNPMVIG